MKKMYQVCGYSHEILTEVEIEKETELSVWVNGCRYAKVSNNYRFFNSHSEAKQYATSQLEIKIKRAESNLENLKEALEKIEKEAE